MDFRPKMLICGGSAYPRDWDYAKFRAIADKCGAMLMMDMAHISGLVAGGGAGAALRGTATSSPTTHKSSAAPARG